MVSITREVLSTLSQLIDDPSSDNNEIVRRLRTVNQCLKSKVDTDTFKHYSRLLENLLKAFRPDVSKHLSKEILREIDSVADNGPAAATLLVLVAKIQTSDNAVQLNHCVQLLEAYLEKDRLEDLLWNECLTTENRRILHDDLVVVIASLPERMANRLRHENRDAFLTAEYIPKLTRSIVRTCLRITEDLRRDRNRDVQFLGALVSKLCQCGHGKELWTEVFVMIGSEFETDFILSRVFEKVLSHVPGNSCESVLVSLLTQCPCYGIVNRLLGDSIRRESRIKFLLTNKLLLHRCYDDTRIISNIMGYVSKFGEILKETLRNLLQVWSGASYVKHTAYEQQLYICSAIVIGLAFMPKETGDFNSFLCERTLQGVPRYLDSGVERIRLLGMVLAEMLTERTSPTGDVLQFEYTDSDDTRKLKSLLVLPPEFCKLENSDARPEESKSSKNESSSITEKLSSVKIDDPDLDSDDDLEPYDVSNDLPKSQVKEPKYIRQCMEGFLVKEDPDTFEMSLKHAAKLVRKNPAQARELAEEFAMIVVRTEDEYDTENFSGLLRDLLTAIVCADPKHVSEKLCQEFYARNYNIRQRLDILDAIAQAAQSLAKLDTVDSKALVTSQSTTSKFPEVTSSDGNVVDDWRTIVDRRVRAKTRRFASASREIDTTENKFGPVAGHFFFPLLSPATVDRSIDIRGRDSVLLVRLLYTLSIVLHSSVNTPIAPKMASELLDFVWLFRTHSEVAVRRGVLFAISMVYLSVPPFVLLREMEEKVSESKYWLEHVLGNDEDDMCRELAKQGLLLLIDALKNNK